MLRGGTEFFLVPSRSKALVWHGQRKLLPSAVRLTAQPRCGHSDDSAITRLARPLGLADQPDRSNRLARVFDPGVAPLFDDGERARYPDFELFEPRERLERFFPPLLAERRERCRPRRARPEPARSTCSGRRWRVDGNRGESFRSFLEAGAGGKPRLSRVSALGGGLDSLGAGLRNQWGIAFLLDSNILNPSGNSMSRCERHPASPGLDPARILRDPAKGGRAGAPSGQDCFTFTGWEWLSERTR